MLLIAVAENNNDLSETVAISAISLNGDIEIVLRIIMWIISQFFTFYA